TTLARCPLRSSPRRRSSDRVYDDRMQRLYLNGALAATDERPCVIGSIGVPLAIGAESNGAYGFSGSLDEAAGEAVRSVRLGSNRWEEQTSELQSRRELVCRV